jgi:uncharacterized protein YbgA (DUF1722 family)/uncharacterized protein YbbK (DUF523 family)
MYNFDPSTIRLGISSCVLGNEVRFDGGHRRSPYCTQVLSNYVEYIPLCPETAIGLDVPRPSIQLRRLADGISAVSASGQDLGAALSDYGRRMARQLDFISGYIVCAKSPSCGMERVRVYDRNGANPAKEGVGLYTQQLMQHNPLLPIEENGRLNDPVLRENFITRVYAYHDWKCLMHDGLTASSLVAFHSRNKFLLLAHDPKTYYQLGPLLSDLSRDLEARAEEYIERFMQALAKVATRKRQCNVLQHIQGFFKDHLSASQREELTEVIERYRVGVAPLMAPLTLINHFLREHPNAYLDQQRYLKPYPDSLALRYGM